MKAKAFSWDSFVRLISLLVLICFYYLRRKRGNKSFMMMARQDVEVEVEVGRRWRTRLHGKSFRLSRLARIVTDVVFWACFPFHVIIFCERLTNFSEFIECRYPKCGKIKANIFLSSLFKELDGRANEKAKKGREISYVYLKSWWLMIEQNTTQKRTRITILWTIKYRL